MRGWQLNPTGVKQVLAAAGEHAEDLAAAVKASRVDWIHDNIAAGGPVGADILEAVQALLDVQARRVVNIGRDASAAVTGVANATGTYAQGQRDMTAATRMDSFDSVADLRAWDRS